MIKELSPLEAWEEVKDEMLEWTEGYEENFDIIETALKTLEQIQIILGAEKLEDLPNLATIIDNELYSTSYKLKQNEKKLGQLENIEEKLGLTLIQFFKEITKINPNWTTLYFKYNGKEYEIKERE